jgi:hypothetical protein
MVLYSNTAMRIDPMIYSGKLSQLRKGEIVTIAEQSLEKTWVSLSNDYWYLVFNNRNFKGWVFGPNLKILQTANQSEIKKISAEFIEDEYEKIKKDLTGKWWSINKFGDFTDHCIELFPDTKYKSYIKGRAHSYEGEYKFDTIKDEIVFLKGSTFQGNLRINRRGQEYTLTKDMEDYELKFQKINSDASDDFDEKLKRPNQKSTNIEKNKENPAKQNDKK